MYEALGLSYRNSAELNKIINTELPAQRTLFTREEVVVTGEAFDLYKRLLLECIHALYGAPQHAQYLCVAPKHHYSDADKTNCLYHDMYTGKWWWSTQVRGFPVANATRVLTFFLEATRKGQAWCYYHSRYPFK